MSEEIIKVLDNLGQKFGIAIDWTNENVLPYLQDLGARFISYQNATAIIWMIISFIVIVASIIVCVKLYKYKKKNKIDAYDDVWIGLMTGWILCGFAIFGFTLALFLNMQGLLQNIYMPELTLLNYVKGLM